MMAITVLIFLAAVLCGLVIAYRRLMFSWLPDRTRAAEIVRLRRAGDRARRMFNPQEFDPPPFTDWKAVVSDILDEERCTFDALLPGGKPGKDLIADAVNCYRYSSDNAKVFGILRVAHPLLPDHIICDAMQTAERLLHAASCIPFGEAITINPKFRRAQSSKVLATNVEYLTKGYEPNPNLMQMLSEYVPGCSEEAYAQAIDELLNKVQRNWIAQALR